MERVHRREKKLMCGHTQIFTSPIPKPYEAVFCLTCNSGSRIYKKPQVRNRCKLFPKRNNQFTKGRQLYG